MANSFSNICNFKPLTNLSKEAINREFSIIEKYICELLGNIITPINPDGNNGGGPNDIPILLGMGQSNEIGGVETTSNAPEYLQGEQSNAYIWFSDEFQPINAGINTNNAVVAPPNGWATEMESTYLLKTDYNKAIYYIKNSAGGQDIAQWDRPNGVRWLELVDYITNAFAAIRTTGKNPYVLAITWRQGEADISTGTLDTYQTKLTSLITAVRELDPALSNIPFIMMTLAVTQDGVSDPHNILRTQLNSIFYNTVYANPALNWIINSDTLEWTTGDSLHFDPTSQISAGQQVRNLISIYPKYNQSDPDATIFINAINATGYTMSALEMGLTRDYITYLKVAGIWNLVIARWIFIGNTAATNQINLKSPGTFDLTAHGSWIYSAADGPTGDNSTTYFGSGLHPNTDLDNSDLHLGIWANNASSDTVGYDIGCHDATKYFLMGYYASNGNSQAFMNGSLTGAVQFASFSGYALFTYDGTTQRGFKNGLELATPLSLSPVGFPTTEMFVGGYNNNGTTDFGAQNYCMFTIGKKMTSDQILIDYKLTQVFLEGINRFRNP